MRALVISILPLSQLGAFCVAKAARKLSPTEIETTRNVRVYAAAATTANEIAASSARLDVVAVKRRRLAQP